HPPIPAAHPLADGTAATLDRSLEATAAGLGSDAAPYRRLLAPALDAWNAVTPILLGPYPPNARAVTSLARRLGSQTPATAAPALAAAEPLLRSHFRGEAARAFLAGHAAHSMLPLDRPPAAGCGP